MQAARKILSTRQGTLGFAAAAAALAIVVLLVFMQSYKRSLDQRADPVTVLVAKDELPKGSSGDVIAAKGLFQATGFKREQVKEGAITDPSSLRGLVTTQTIVPGQQLTTADFAKPTDPVMSKLSDNQRAVTVPLDSAHGMIGQISRGRPRRRVRRLPGPARRRVATAARPARAVPGRRGARGPGRRPEGKAASPSRTRRRTSSCASPTSRPSSWPSPPTTARSGSRCARRPAPPRRASRSRTSTGWSSGWTRSRSTASARRARH